MEKHGTDDVEAQADTPDDQDDLGVLYTLKLDEALDGLHGDAQAEG